MYNLVVSKKNRFFVIENINKKDIAMKRLNFIFLLTILMSMTGINAYAYDIAVENADGVTIYYNYIKNETELEVTGKFIGAYENIVSYQGDIVIPEDVTIENKTLKVTAIGEKAFYYCYDLTSINIPYSVTSIGEGAFHWCTGLISVVIPNSVTSIHSFAFSSCLNMTSITIPNSVTTIGEKAFLSCTSLSSIKLPESLTTIADYLFDNCSNLTSITIPKSVSSIGENPFRYCKLSSIIVEEGNLNYHSNNNCNAIIETSTNKLIIGCNNTIIPNDVTEIGKYAFQYCSDMTAITIPNSVRYIDDYSFEGCKGLTSITLPNNVTSIGYLAFYQCGNHISFSPGLLILPDSMDYIGEGAFANSTVSTAVFPRKLESISRMAFSSCKYLTTVIIPETVVNIGDSAFRCCDRLSEVKILGSSLKSIGKCTFKDCPSLTSINIPNSVIEICDSAFYKLYLETSKQL